MRTPTSKLFVPIGLLIFFALCLVPAHAQVGVINSQTITASGTSVRINNCITPAGVTSNACSGLAAMTASFEELIAGSPATVSIIASGCSSGGTCDVLDSYTTVANSIRKPSLIGAYNYFSVQASWTGGSNVSVTVNTTLFAASGNPTVTATVSGPVNQGNPNSLANAWANKITDGANGPVAVKGASAAAGASDPALVVAQSPNTPLPAGSNAIGTVTATQGTGSNLHTTVDSLPALPTGGNTVGNVNQSIGSAGFNKVTDGTNTAAVKAASTAAGATDPALVASLSPNSPLPTGANTIGQVNTQPAGFGSVLTGQQSVTGSAVALPSNSAHGLCVKALIGNTIDVFVGPTGITTATGYPLSAGDSICYQVSNSNLIFVIASTTGASVSWTVN